jgi:hypothetical protein
LVLIDSAKSYKSVIIYEGPIYVWLTVWHVLGHVARNYNIEKLEKHMHTLTTTIV